VAAASIMATWHFLSDLDAETSHTEELARLCDVDLARARPPAAHHRTDGRGDMLSHLAALLLTISALWQGELLKCTYTLVSAFNASIGTVLGGRTLVNSPGSVMMLTHDLSSW